MHKNKSALYVGLIFMCLGIKSPNIMGDHNFRKMPFVEKTGKSMKKGEIKVKNHDLQKKVCEENTISVVKSQCSFSSSGVHHPHELKLIPLPITIYTIAILQMS